MKKSTWLLGGSTLAALASLGFAAPAQAQSTTAESDEIVVTGSHIRGTPETAALPVDVISAAELQRQGNPNMVEIMRSIPASTGVFGDSNQFTAGQSTGSGNVNLRSLGAPRTLVLLNGRRMVIGPALNGGVDTNLLPQMAIGRIEVLRDGAAATYGSDAIGGVVNFITRRDLDGLEVRGNYSAIEGSDGDYDAGLNWGAVFDRGNILLSAGHRHRSELDTLDRDFSSRPFTAFDPAAFGGWSSFSNPGPYAIDTGITQRFLDPACTELSGFQSAATTCRFSFANFDNLVEDEDHYQLYGELNYELTENIDLHLEALWAAHYVEGEASSPSYGPVQGPGSIANGSGVGALAGHFIIPETNPGLTPGFIAQLPANVQTYLGQAGTQNLFTIGLLWRPLALGGNPLFGDGSKHDQRNFEGWRVSGGLSGEFAGGVGWNVNISYGENESDISTPDIIVSRLGYALRGLGGPNCDTDPVTPGVQGTPGVGGCMWFNPFSTGVAQNPATGDQNGLTFDPATVNDLAVIDWMFEEYAYQVTTSQLVIDAVFDGETGINLPGGPIAWALGAQYRDQGAERVVNDFTNIDVNPCVNLGDTTCTQRNGPFSFFGPLSNYDLGGDNYALFGELSLPIFDNLEAQLAVRFEDYGGAVGDTINPKISVRWQVTDWFALRGSAGTTFRAPPVTQLDPGFATLLAFTSAVGGYRAYDTFGNPNLQPETATTYNIGAILNAGPLRATIDYFNFEFEDPIMTEGGTRMATALFVTGGNHCGQLAYAGLQSRFDFGVNPCAPAAMLRARVETINGPTLTISGMDASATLDLGELLGGEGGRWVVGGDVTYLQEWFQDELLVEGIVTRPATDYAGTYDHAGYNATPQWKGSAFIEWDAGPLMLRWTTRYVGEMQDLRPINPNHPTALIDSYMTHDLSAVAEITEDTVLTAAFTNITNEDPPFAGTDLGYDPFTGTPLGRVFRIGLRHTF
ncbi:MAG: TonB-dependent receptor plug domain-containing protein [Hyphomonadaceae bacterium]